MNTNMTGLRWFSKKNLCILVLRTQVALASEGLIKKDRAAMLYQSALNVFFQVWSFLPSANMKVISLASAIHRDLARTRPACSMDRNFPVVNFSEETSKLTF